ncbi:MAG: lactate racemase domain-containing protein [Frisingicoccus sp.]
MEHPIDSPRLFELAKDKPDCTIIISDHTRPVPGQDILPHMIRELRMGNPDIRDYPSWSPQASIVRQALMN